MPVSDLSPSNDSDVLDGGGGHIELTVGTSAVHGKVGASNRAGRKYVVFQAQDQGIYYGFDNTVTISNGIQIFKSQILMLPLGEGTDIYFISSGAGNKVRFQEVS